MRASKQKREQKAAGNRQPVWLSFLWIFLGSLVLGFAAYQPALNGPFVFDDYTLPFRLPGFRAEALRDWVTSVRPLLMASYWVNFQISGRTDTLSYHVVNLLVHCATSALIGIILFRLLRFTPADERKRQLLSILGAGVFLLHPVQAESVAYIAGRSESLSAFFSAAALALFLYRRNDAISWRESIPVLILFAAACLTKEHAVALVGVFLLTDYFLASSFSMEAVRRNWRLYAPLTAGAVIATVAALSVVIRSESAGFSLTGLPWYSYLFTQMRVIFLYISFFFVPLGLTVDHDFPVSATLFDYGSIVALIALAIGVAAAIRFRRRYPLACYGFLLFLVLLAPTSSVIPIKDLVAERRMYLPILGLLLIVLDAFSRVPMTAPVTAIAGASLLAVLGPLTHARSEGWGDEVRLWEDAISAAPAKPRPYGNLASVYLRGRKCQDANQVFERATRAAGPIEDAYLLSTWGLTLDCLGQKDLAIAKMEQSAQRQPSAQVYATLGRMYINSSRLSDAEQAFARAEQIDPRWEMTYIYRGLAFSAQNDFDAAATQYRRALSLNPSNSIARDLLAQIRTRSRSNP